MKTRITPLLLAALCGTVAAQTKTDGEWRGSGGAALAMTSGNSTASTLALNADATRATADDKISLGGAINRATSTTGGQKQTTASKWGGFGQYDLNLTKQLFAFGRLGLESDKLVQLRLRNDVAGGLGYKLVNTDQTSFDVFGGLGYSTDRYSVTKTIGGRSATSFSRSSIYLGESSAHKLSSTVSFKQRLDLFPGMSGDKALLARFNAGLAVALSGTMNLTVGLTASHNSKPPAGAKATDTGLFTGVNLKFGAL